MTEFSSPKDELVASLRSYTSLLQTRNEALSRISSTSQEIRSILNRNPLPDINDALQRRDQDLARYAAACDRGMADDQEIVDTAIAAAQSANDELASIARSVIALHEDSRTLAEEVLTCQSECEALLKARIKATSQALQESTQRRKLDATYGPACKHETPMFMDKQR